MTDFIVKPIKTDSDEWLLDVLGVPFGGPFNGRDHDGEYFDANTELWLDQIGKRAIVHYHGRGQDGKSDDRPEVIGREVGYEVRDDGVWFQVVLDKGKQIASDLWQAAQNGFARASSGAISHLVRKGDEGHIAVWPVGEISLMNIDTGNIPSNPYAIATPALRSAFKAAQIEWPDILNDTDEGREGAEPSDPEAVEEKQPEETNEVKAMDNKPETPQNPGLTKDDILAILDARDAEKAEKQRIEELEAAKQELEALKAQIAEEKKEQEGKEQVKRIPNPTQETRTPDIQVVGKYDGFSVGELGLAYDMLKTVNADISPELFKTLHAKAVKGVDELYANQIKRNEKGEILREFSPETNYKAVRALKAFDPNGLGDKAFKANELMYSTQASGGDEWVPTLWSAELWDKVRNMTRVLSLFRQVEVPGESLTIPALQGTTTVYKIGQSTDQADLDIGSNVNAVMSKATTANVTLTPAKGMAWLGFSEEFVEDSIVPVITSLQQSLALDIAEQIDEVLISGDTDTGTTNISTRGATFAATSRFLLLNGLRDAAFADSNTSDRGTLAAADFTAVMALLGTNGAFALDPDRLVWILDPITYRAALALGENLTKETGVATVTNGRIGGLFGSRVIVSDQYAITDSTGYIDGVTAANNTLGSFLLVRPDRGVVGFGRRIRIEQPARDAVSIVSDTRHLVASFRMDFQKHQEVAALGFNVS